MLMPEEENEQHQNSIAVIKGTFAKTKRDNSGITLQHIALGEPDIELTIFRY